MKPTLWKRLGCLVFLGLAFLARELSTEQLTMTSILPAPTGAYVTFRSVGITTLARDSGQVIIGNPNGTGPNRPNILRIMDETQADRLVLTSDVSGNASWQGGSFSTMAVFDTPGLYSWSVPAGVTKVLAEVWGGGGGGSATFPGGGGGYGKRVVAPAGWQVNVGLGGVGCDPDPANRNGGPSSLFVPGTVYLGVGEGLGGTSVAGSGGAGGSYGAGSGTNPVLGIPGESGNAIGGGQGANGGSGGKGSSGSSIQGVSPGGGGAAPCGNGAPGRVILYY
ncbi:MAG: hypothetical protein HY399_08355 [Elusimicrobia bacterium]|nr:hypothetical protein [Elusimicrobiota bacterium]